VSIYETQHSIDIQRIDIPSRQFDCVICNHVLEHVPNDRDAISELFRLVSDRGFCQIGVPDPIRRTVTRDWGYPKWEDHGHFRLYGADVIDRFREVIRGGFVIRLVERDPVTAMDDMYFILTRSEKIVSTLRQLYPELQCEWIDDAGACIEGFEIPINERAPHGTGCPFTTGYYLSSAVNDTNAFNDYFMRGGHREVQGWVTDGALAAITHFSALMRGLSVNGHVCEIGVHHGRFTIAASLLRRLGERTLAIDVFEDQDLNPDNSGSGDSAVFSTNCRRWLGEEHDVITLKADSLNVTPEIVVDKVGGRIRLFSVDGSHTVLHTLNDIRIAEGSVTDGGLVVVDDFLNPAWPGVPEAIFMYLREDDRPTKLMPVGYGDNKFYFTTRSHAAAYRTYLESRLLPVSRKSKLVELCGYEMYFFSLPALSETLDTIDLKIGQKVHFGSGGDGLALLRSGWHKPEKSGVWSTEIGGLIELRLPIVDSTAFALRIEFGGFSPQVDQGSRAEVTVNGDLVAVHALTDRVERHFLEIARPVADLGRDGRVELVLHNSHACSPRDIGLSSDHRKLGLHLISIERLS